MHDIFEEILPWILIGITLLSYLGSAKKEKRKPTEKHEDEPGSEQNFLPTGFAELFSQQLTTAPEEESVAQADNTAYDFTPQNEGVSDIVPEAKPVAESRPADAPPMAAIKKERLSERKRRLRRLIVIGEVLQPKFDSSRL